MEFKKVEKLSVERAWQLLENEFGDDILDIMDERKKSKYREVSILKKTRKGEVMSRRFENNTPLLFKNKKEGIAMWDGNFYLFKVRVG